MVSNSASLDNKEIQHSLQTNKCLDCLLNRLSRVSRSWTQLDHCLLERNLGSFFLQFHPILRKINLFIRQTQPIRSRFLDFKELCLVIQPMKAKGSMRLANHTWANLLKLFLL
ncbi:hypothetical protein XENOCAPTIV_007708 [Xenoophorus captivus]|uniref:Uncharacterized protein n=1 Tax=Xenoophorus captivus TaxID=1517983 RepID=A0ABV0SE00_9TELE